MISDRMTADYYANSRQHDHQATEAAVQAHAKAAPERLAVVRISRESFAHTRATPQMPTGQMVFVAVWHRPVDKSRGPFKFPKGRGRPTNAVHHISSSAAGPSVL